MEEHMSTKTIQIPATIEEAITQLGGLGQLLTAKGWQRAAIIWAFTFEPKKPGPRKRDSSEVSYLTCKEFAALGIHGLRSDVTVADHRRNWQDAIDRGVAQSVTPGMKVVLPKEDYPPTGHAGGVRDLITTKATTDERLKVVRHLLAEDPEAQRVLDQEFIQKAGRDPSLVAKIDRVYEEHHPKAGHKERAAGAFELIVGLGVGTELLSHARKQQREVDELAAALAAYHGDLPDDVFKAVTSVREKLAQTTAIITGYDEQIATAMGVDYDAVFRRLTGSA
jgi:hypothetical protein